MYQKISKNSKKKKKGEKSNKIKGSLLRAQASILRNETMAKRTQEAGEEAAAAATAEFWRERKKGGDGGGFKRIETAERFEPTNTKGGSFPFESDTLTVGGTSGVSGQTRIVPDADEKQRERRGENAGIRVEGTV